MGGEGGIGWGAGGRRGGVEGGMVWREEMRKQGTKGWRGTQAE